MTFFSELTGFFHELRRSAATRVSGTPAVSGVSGAAGAPAVLHASDTPGASGAKAVPRVSNVSAVVSAVSAAFSVSTAPGPCKGGFAQRRRLMTGSATLGLGMMVLPFAAGAQAGTQAGAQGSAPPLEADPAEVRRIIAEFLQDAQPIEEGLKIEMSVLADNPASVPVRVILEQAVTPESYCEELIVIAEGNPRPLASRFRFTPLVGNIDVGVRLRLIDSQSIRTMARMNDGRILVASQHVVVTAGGCGM